MPTTVIFEIQAKPGTGNQLVSALKQGLPETRSREGCLGLEVHQNLDDADDLVAIETWESRAAYESYLKWRQENGAFGRLLAACAGPPRIRFFDLTDA